MGAEVSLCSCDEERELRRRPKQTEATNLTPRHYTGPSNPSTMAQGAPPPSHSLHSATAFNPDGPALRTPSKAEYFDVQPMPTGSSQQPCGIGIQFRTDRTGAMVVQDLIEGGPADSSNKVFPGDVLYMVENKLVLRSPLNEIAESIRGPKGSSVTVVFLRNGQHVKVTLTRAPGFKIGGVQSSPAVLGAKDVEETGGAVGGGGGLSGKGRSGEPMSPRPSAYANTRQ